MSGEASGTKRPAGILKFIDRPLSEALPSATYDSDFDDDKVQPPPKKAKATAAAPSVPASRKPTPRLQAAGVDSLDKAIAAARDNERNGRLVHVVVVSLSFREQDKCDADHLVVATQRDGTSYDLPTPSPKEEAKALVKRRAAALAEAKAKAKAEGKDASKVKLPPEPDREDVGESEFMGLFYSGPPTRADPGVADQIAELLDASDANHVVVIDASARGVNYARLAAGVGALRYGCKNAAAGKALYAALTKPKSQTLRAALARAHRCRSWYDVREKMREHYVDHLAG